MAALRTPGATRSPSNLGPPHFAKALHTSRGEETKRIALIAPTLVLESHGTELPLQRHYELLAQVLLQHREVLDGDFPRLAPQNKRLMLPKVEHFNSFTAAPVVIMHTLQDVDEPMQRLRWPSVGSQSALTRHAEITHTVNNQFEVCLVLVLQSPLKRSEDFNLEKACQGWNDDKI